jgi:hypothetical protein
MFNKYFFNCLAFQSIFLFTGRKNYSVKYHRRFFLTLSLAIVFHLHGVAQKTKIIDTTARQTEKQLALNYLDSIGVPSPSKFWPNVAPIPFYENVRKNILNPVAISAGRGTNFCAYATFTYTCIVNEPLRYAKAIVELYNQGHAFYRKVHLTPSKQVKFGAGLILFSGDLDNNPADQLWFLTLAHEFKGYINLFNRRYNHGDENTLWASCNLAKFNRMFRRMCKYKVGSRGCDLQRVHVKNIVTFLQNKLANGEVYLYWNHTIIRRKDHNKIRKVIPTHFVALKAIKTFQNTGMIQVEYWDGGIYTIKTLNYNTLQKVLYGITWTKYSATND